MCWIRSSWVTNLSLLYRNAVITGDKPILDVSKCSHYGWQTVIMGDKPILIAPECSHYGWQPLIMGDKPSLWVTHPSLLHQNAVIMGDSPSLWVTNRHYGWQTHPCTRMRSLWVTNRHYGWQTVIMGDKPILDASELIHSIEIHKFLSRLMVNMSDPEYYMNVFRDVVLPRSCGTVHCGAVHQSTQLFIWLYTRSTAWWGSSFWDSSLWGSPSVNPVVHMTVHTIDCLVEQFILGQFIAGQSSLWDNSLWGSPSVNPVVHTTVYTIDCLVGQLIVGKCIHCWHSSLYLFISHSSLALFDRFQCRCCRNLQLHLSTDIVFWGPMHEPRQRP